MTCALAAEDRTREYKATVAGLSSNVKWMMVAPVQTSCFLTVANGRYSSATLTFNVLSHMDTTEIGLEHFQKHVQAWIGAATRSSHKTQPQV